MSLTTPYASAVDTGRLLAPLVSDLKTWVTTQKGAFFFARDPLETLTLLAESPNGHRVILQYDSDRPVGSQVAGYPNPVLNTTIKVIVSFNPGLNLARDKTIITGDANRSSLMRIVADVRSRMMAYRWPTALVNEGALSYDGTRPYALAEYLPFAAYELTFSFDHVTPMPTSTVTLTVT